MIFKPMLAKIHKNENVYNGEYIFEPKIDGYRALCYKNSDLKFLSRNGNNLTLDFPELQLPKLIKAESAVLDGEIVIYNQKGMPDFGLIQNRKNRSLKAFFVVFDILMLDGEDVTALPLEKRKLILEKVVSDKENFQIIFFTEDGELLLNEIKKKNVEGMIAKKKDSVYEQGRSSSWIKIKINKTADCVIIGYSSLKKDISSLLLGLYKNGKLIYVGKVGTGFNERNLPEIRERLEGIVTDRDRHVSWVKPEVVCEIKFLEMTKDGRFRAPVYLRLRSDKKPEECDFEQIV
jgi:bifunctional non-homologous end joining protein LigD